ncbi:MAG: hypothetical protein HQL48_09895 [Gammaproteobacteria bacterium]|nr:hypothetical protein [Gammaproteobacteria bacterium]
MKPDLPSGVDFLGNPRGWIEQVVSELLQTVTALLPHLLGALLLLLLGWFAALLVRWLIVRFGYGLDALLRGVERQMGLRMARRTWSVTAVLGNISYWLVIAYAFIYASELLGLLGLASWLQQLVGYLPTLLIAGMILFIGYLISNGVRDLVAGACRSEGIRHGPYLSHLASAVVLFFSLLLALDHFGLDTALLEQILLIVVAALFGSLALAFGLGAGDAVRNVMATHYLRQIYQPGQYIRVFELQGEILELTAGGVLLETEEGPTLIAAVDFLNGRPVFIEEEHHDE